MKHLPAIGYLVRHKTRVLVHSILLGVPLRGLAHDLSKLNRVEYLGIGRHFYPSHPREKERNQALFREAKALHRARNEHEVDRWYGAGETCSNIPEPVRREIVCDWAAFHGLAFSLEEVRKNARMAYSRWARNYRMHPDTRRWFERFLELE
jgi:hypothetical protein